MHCATIRYNLCTSINSACSLTHFSCRQLLWNEIQKARIMRYIHESEIQCFSAIPWLDPCVLYHMSASIIHIFPGLSVYDYWRRLWSISPLFLFFSLTVFLSLASSPAFFMASLCSCNRGLSEVCDHHLGFSKLLHTSTNRLDHTLQSPIKSLQVKLSQDGSEWILSQRLSHHITETILWFRQQLQPEQRRALDPGRRMSITRMNRPKANTLNNIMAITVIHWNVLLAFSNFISGYNLGEIQLALYLTKPFVNLFVLGMLWKNNLFLTEICFLFACKNHNLNISYIQCRSIMKKLSNLATSICKIN